MDLASDGSAAVLFAVGARRIGTAHGARVNVGAGGVLNSLFIPENVFKSQEIDFGFSCIKESALAFRSLLTNH
jgi:hypothetical protein